MIVSRGQYSFVPFVKCFAQNRVARTKFDARTFLKKKKEKSIERRFENLNAHSFRRRKSQFDATTLRFHCFNETWSSNIKNFRHVRFNCSSRRWLPTRVTINPVHRPRVVEILRRRSFGRIVCSKRSFWNIVEHQDSKKNPPRVLYAKRARVLRSHRRWNIETRDSDIFKYLLHTPASVLSTNRTTVAGDARVQIQTSVEQLPKRRWRIVTPRSYRPGNCGISLYDRPIVF